MKFDEFCAFSPPEVFLSDGLYHCYDDNLVHEVEHFVMPIEHFVMPSEHFVMPSEHFVMPSQMIGQTLSSALQSLQGKQNWFWSNSMLSYFWIS